MNLSKLHAKKMPCMPFSKPSLSLYLPWYYSQKDCCFDSLLPKSLLLYALVGCFLLGHLQYFTAKYLRTLRCSGMFLTIFYTFSPSLHPTWDSGGSCNNSSSVAMRFSALLEQPKCFISPIQTCQRFNLC